MKHLLLGSSGYFNSKKLQIITSLGLQPRLFFV